MQKEKRLALNLLKFYLNKKHKKNVEKLLKQHLDWDKFFEFSRGHGLSPIIFKSLKKLHFDNNIMERFLIDYSQCYLRNIAIYTELEKVSKALKKNDIPLILLKGVCLTKYIYKDLGFRWIGDIDLLVKEEDYLRVKDLFSQEGFIISEAETKPDISKYPMHLLPKTVRYLTFAHTSFNNRKVNIDLHCHYLMLGVPPLEVDSQWEGLVKIKDNMFMLSPEYHLISLCYHLHKHSFIALRWFLDIALLINNYKIDWKKVVNLSRKEEVWISVYYTLFFLKRFFNIKIPPSCLNRKPVFWRRYIFNKIWNIESILNLEPTKNKSLFIRESIVRFGLYMAHPALRYKILNMLLMGRIKDKVSYWWDYTFPPRRWLKSNGISRVNRFYIQRVFSKGSYYAKHILGFSRRKQD